MKKFIICIFEIVLNLPKFALEIIKRPKFYSEIISFFMVRSRFEDCIKRFLMQAAFVTSFRSAFDQKRGSLLSKTVVA